MLGPTAIEGGGGSGSSSSNRNLFLRNHGWASYIQSSRASPHHHRPPLSTITASAAVNGRQQNHYVVLGVSADASPSDIKRAYRLLALKVVPSFLTSLFVYLLAEILLRYHLSIDFVIMMNNCWQIYAENGEKKRFDLWDLN